MFDPAFTSDRPERRRHIGPISLTVAFLLAVFVTLGLVVFAPSEKATPPAHGSALTSVRNSTSEAYKPIYVLRDNGLRVPVEKGQIVWGVKSVQVQYGTCVSINGGTAICSTSGWRTVNLGVGSYLVRRTK